MECDALPSHTSPCQAVKSLSVAGVLRACCLRAPPRFLFGESHTIPFVVVAQDGFTAMTYKVHVERQCPWYMRADVMQMTAKVTSTVSIVTESARACSYYSISR